MKLSTPGISNVSFIILDTANLVKHAERGIILKSVKFLTVEKIVKLDTQGCAKWNQIVDSLKKAYVHTNM